MQHINDGPHTSGQKGGDGREAGVFWWGGLDKNKGKAVEKY